MPFTDPLTLLAIEIFGGFGLLDAPILVLVWGVHRRTQATWPIVTILDKRSPREIQLIAHYLNRQIESILYTEDKGVHEGLFSSEHVDTCPACSAAELEFQRGSA